MYTDQQWDAIQERAVNPFRTNEANAVNRLTRVLTLDKDFVLNKNNCQIVNFKTVKILKSHYIKDDVYIYFKQDVDLDFTNLDNYFSLTNRGFNSAGKYYIVMHYVFVESIPFPIAKFKILKDESEITPDFLRICNVDVIFNQAQNRYEIVSLDYEKVHYLNISVLHEQDKQVLDTNKVANLAPRATDPNSNRILLTSGYVINADSNQIISVPETLVGPFNPVSSANKKRFDLVTATINGVIKIYTGNEVNLNQSINDSIPTLPTDEYPIALVYIHETSNVVITNQEIIDLRLVLRTTQDWRDEVLALINADIRLQEEIDNVEQDVISLKLWREKLKIFNQSIDNLKPVPNIPSNNYLIIKEGKIIDHNEKKIENINETLVGPFNVVTTGKKRCDLITVNIDGEIKKYNGTLIDISENIIGSLPEIPEDEYPLAAVIVNETSNVKIDEDDIIDFRFITNIPHSHKDEILALSDVDAFLFNKINEIQTKVLSLEEWRSDIFEEFNRFTEVVSYFVQSFAPIAYIGDLWFDTSTNALKKWNGSSWETVNWQDAIKRTLEWQQGYISIGSDGVYVNGNLTYPLVGAKVFRIRTFSNTSYSPKYYLLPGCTVRLVDINHVPIAYVKDVFPMYDFQYYWTYAYEAWVGLRPNNTAISDGNGQCLVGHETNILANRNTSLTIIPFWETSATSTNWGFGRLSITSSKWFFNGMCHASAGYAISATNCSGTPASNSWWLGTWILANGIQFTPDIVAVTRII